MAKPPAPRPEKPPEPVEKRPIEEVIEGVLRNRVPGREVHVLSREIAQIVVSESFSGPIPHPIHLREYDQILPGGADRLMAMAETNLKHGMDMERKALEAQIADGKRGMWIGAALFALLIVLAAAIHLITGSEAVPGVFLGAAVLGGIALFVRRSKDGT